MYYPFTSSQWKELEQQALIFKYLACGLPIPHDLIMQIKNSFLLNISIGPSPSPNFTFLSPYNPSSFSQSPDGWGSVQTSFGRKTEDKEPGRCRRTDGKKWRCSREASQDSKYCERHMHRGKNRSRKLVELSLATNTKNVYHPSSSSSSSSPYSSFKNSGSVGLSLADNNHKGCYGERKEFEEEEKMYVDQYGNKGNGFWFLSESNGKKQNQFVLGANLMKTEHAEKPKSFHCFFD